MLFPDLKKNIISVVLYRVKILINKKPIFASSDAPEFKNNTENVYVDEGSNVTLHCEAEGHPLPRIQWTLDEMDLMGTNNLNLTGVTDSATYNCTATNDLGSISKQIHVHVMKTTTTAAPAAAPAITTPAAATRRGIHPCVFIV